MMPKFTSVRFQVECLNTAKQPMLLRRTSSLYYRVIAMPTVLVQIGKFETDGEAGSPELPPDSFELSFEHNTTVRELIRRTVEENAKAQMRQSRRHLHQ